MNKWYTQPSPVAKQNEEPLGQATKAARGCLFRHTYILELKTNLQRWQIALELIPPLELHGVIE